MEASSIAIIAGVAGNVVLLLGGLSMWLGHRARRAERLEQASSASPGALAAIEARLEELTRAVEIVGLEVERLGEAQRFAALHAPPDEARALEAPRSTPSAAGRIVTPH